MSDAQAFLRQTTGSALVGDILCVLLEQPNQPCTMASIAKRLNMTVSDIQPVIRELASSRAPYRYGFPWLTDASDGVLLTTHALAYVNHSLPPDTQSVTGWTHCIPSGRDLLLLMPDNHRTALLSQLCETQPDEVITLLVGDEFESHDSLFDDTDTVIWSRSAAFPKLSRILHTLPKAYPLRVITTHRSAALLHIRAAYPAAIDIVVINEELKHSAPSLENQLDGVVLMKPYENVTALHTLFKMPAGWQRLPSISQLQKASVHNPIILDGRRY